MQFIINTHFNLKSIFIVFIIILSIPRMTACRNQNVRPENYQSLLLHIYKDNQFLRTATGFIIRPNENYYLITSWQVVSGKNISNLKWLNKKKKVSPNTIKIFYNSQDSEKCIEKCEKLYNSNSSKRYKEFKIGNETVDVVAIPLSDTIGKIVLSPIEYDDELNFIEIRPTDRVIVLGFPLDIKNRPFFPIWKNGYIASEPYLDFEEKPIVLIDIKGLGGMVGSPVYLMGNRYISKNGKNQIYFGTSGLKSLFFGIYTHDNKNDIGKVWKSQYLVKLFKSLP